jgi:hypothetical protein
MFGTSMLIIFSILIITTMTKKVLSNQYLIAKEIKNGSSGFTLIKEHSNQSAKSFLKHTFFWHLLIKNIKNKQMKELRLYIY